MSTPTSRPAGRRPRVVVTTVPFAAHDRLPIDLLAGIGADVTINPLGRRLRPEEVADVIRGHDVIIAGTETIPPASLDACPEVRAICRVGIGLDGVPLLHCRERGIAVSYTPDAPSAAVAELAIGLMIDLLRGVGRTDRGLRTGRWERFMGRRIARSTVGIVGMGRIGSRVARHLLGGFPGVKVLANDLECKTDAPAGVEWADLQAILANCDVITLHVPLTPLTAGMISAEQLNRMKPGAVLLNTARGGLIDEDALAAALIGGRLSAAVDTFIEEPYRGPLTEIENAVLTCHMGSMTADCRTRMEIEATEEAVRFLRGDALSSPVPASEYDIAALRLKP